VSFNKILREMSAIYSYYYFIERGANRNYPEHQGVDRRSAE